jgi:hypothetical protein
MNFKKPQDAIRFLSHLGLRAEFPVDGGVFMAVNPHTKERFEVIGKRIWVTSKDEYGEKKRWLDEDPVLIREIEESLRD